MVDFFGRGAGERRVRPALVVPADRVTQVTSTLAGLSTAIGSVTFDQKHDLAGRRVRQTAQYDGSEVLDYQNDVTVL